MLSSVNHLHPYIEAQLSLGGWNFVVSVKFDTDPDAKSAEAELAVKKTFEITKSLKIALDAKGVYRFGECNPEYGIFSLTAKVSVTGFPKSEYLSVEDVEGTAEVKKDCDENLVIKVEAQATLSQSPKLTGKAWYRLTTSRHFTNYT